MGSRRILLHYKANAPNWATLRAFHAVHGYGRGRYRYPGLIDRPDVALVSPALLFLPPAFGKGLTARLRSWGVGYDAWEVLPGRDAPGVPRCLVHWAPGAIHIPRTERVLRRAMFGYRKVVPGWRGKATYRYAYPGLVDKPGVERVGAGTLMLPDELAAELLDRLRLHDVPHWSCPLSVVRRSRFRVNGHEIAERPRTSAHRS